MIKANKKSFKQIFALVFMIVLFCGSIFSATFAFFSDKHDNYIDINVAKMQTETTTQELEASDLTAGNEFTKTITYKLTGYDVYFRVYAITKMQTYDNAGVNIIERTDLIDLINVSSAKKGSDNKYYYVATGVTPATSASGTYALNFTFKVSNLVSEDLFMDSEFVHNSSLKTTITYYFEYCQVSGWDDWNNYSSVNSQAQSVNYQFNAKTSQSTTPTQTTPQTLNNAGDLITEENRSFYYASESQVGKYALALSNGACDNLINVNNLVDNSALVNNGDGTYTLNVTESNDKQSKTANCYLPKGKYVVSTNILDYSYASRFFTLEIKYTDNTTQYSAMSTTSSFDSETNRYYVVIDFNKDVKSIALIFPTNLEIGNYTTFKDFKIEKNDTLTSYLPYGYGKNLFEYQIAKDVQDDTRSDGFACNLTEGLTYRLSYNTNKGNLSWFKISNADSGYNCVQYGSNSSNATTPITTSTVYNGFVFTFTRHANINASATLYIFLRINGEVVTTLNYYLAEELGIKLEVIYNAPAGKNIFTSSILDYRSNGNTFVYDEDSQIFTINKTSSTNALSTSIYKLTNAVPTGTNVTIKIFVVNGSLTTTSSGLTIGGYHKVDGDSNSWQGFYETKELTAGDTIARSMTTTNTMTDFWLFMPAVATCENLQIKVMLELATSVEASLTYVSYKPSGTTFIYLNEPLRSTSNVSGTSVYSDYIDLKRGVVVRKTNAITITGYSALDGITYSCWQAQNGETTIAGYVSGDNVFGKYDASKPNAGGKYVANVGSCSHFALSSTFVHSVSENTGFSVIPAASPPYVAFRIASTTNSVTGVINFFKEQYDAGTPVELILAYYGDPKYDTVNLPLSLMAGDEELNLYSLSGTFSIN